MDTELYRTIVHSILQRSEVSLSLADLKVAIKYAYKIASETKREIIKEQYD